MAMQAPTTTDSPSLMNTSLRMPPHMVVTPMVALLVSTSKISWSASTVSPWAASRRSTVASAMESPSWGIRMGTLGMMETGLNQMDKRWRMEAAMDSSVGRCAFQRLGCWGMGVSRALSL